MPDPTFNNQLIFSNTPDNSRVDLSNIYNPTQDAVLNNLNNMYGKIMPKYEHNYELLKFIPNANMVGSRPVGCAVPAEGKNDFLVSMIPINNDSNLHTVDSCKLAASLQFADIKYQEKINGAQSQLTPGLKFKIVDGYFNDNITHVIKSTAVAEGIATDFSSIQTSTNNHPRIDQHVYTVEWNGIIIPDETGNWTFSTRSDDASYLWIGDTAATPSNSNALVNNGRLHGMFTVTRSIHLIKGTHYKFRMQFGENWGGYNNILSVTPPTQSKGDRYYGVLFVDKGPVLKQMYYALRENSKKDTEQGLFKCYVTNPDDTTTVPSQIANINNTITGGYYNTTEYGILWQGLASNQVPNSGAITAEMTEEGYFNIVSNGSTVRSLFNVNNYNDLNNNPVINQSSTNPYPKTQYLFLYLRGENWDVNATTASVTLEMWGYDVGGSGQWQHLSNIFTEGTITVHDSVPNYNWAKQCRFGCCDTNTKLPFILSWKPRKVEPDWIYKNGITATNYLISWDGRFKLSLSTDGATTNLNLYYSKKPCQNTTTDPASNTKVVYSAMEDGASQYLYSLSIDHKLNKMFYANDLSQSLQYVPTTPNSILKSFGYSYVGHFAPPSGIVKDDKMNENHQALSDCELKCSNASNCNYFYYYQDKNTKNGQSAPNSYCTLGTQATNGNILPQGAINTVQPNWGMVNPSLYISNKNFDMGPDCMVQPIYANNVTSYDDANNYLKHSLNSSPLNQVQPLGYIQEKDYLDWQSKEQSLLFGANNSSPNTAKCLNSLKGKESFAGMDTTNTVEPFNNYNMNSCTVDGTRVGCVSFIEDSKIKPLLDANSQYMQTLNQLNENNVYLTNQISNYKTIRGDLSGNPNAHYWDMSDNHLLYPVPTLLDTANSDANMLMMQQNNMYIAGTMTTATLLILAIMLGTS
jgi:hypothetical protein